MTQPAMYCSPQVVGLCRDCREHISWPISGVDNTAQVFAQLDDGPWYPLVMSADLRTAIGYFAGPGLQQPGAAVVVARTSWVRIQVVTASEVLTFPGGFIRLTR